MSRADVEPIMNSIRAARQKDARHYGVHPYFTRRPANVVRAYVERYSRENDVVLDPFGGTGVTAIESFLRGRRAVQNDLNPFANFIAANIATTQLASVEALREAFARVAERCEGVVHDLEECEDSARRWLKKVPLPENIALPRTSDARVFYELFTPRQLAGLAVLKDAIGRESDAVLRNLLLLAWSASVAKLNKTFLSAKGRAASRGGSSIFSIYRYKLATEFVELPIWSTFCGRFENVVAAKHEVLQMRRLVEQRSGGSRTLDSARDFRVLAHDAALLDEVLEPASIDYIFTDPPYGGYINYLDLSILWNHWLGFPISDDIKRMETIVGGEVGHSEEHYKTSLERAIKTCMRLLRPDRWFSVVFQHWDLSYFATILNAATCCGAELKSAITQTGDVIWSMHKKKNSASLLSGEMILTFYKPTHCHVSGAHPMSPRQIGSPEDALYHAMDRCLSDATVSQTNESLYNRLVMELWRQGAMDSLALDRRTFIRHMEQRGWTYDRRTHKWSKGDCPRNGAVEGTLFENV